MMKTQNKKQKKIGFVLLSAVLALGFSLSSFAAVIEYGNLRQLIVEGNQNLKNNAYYDNVEDLEYQLAILKQECHDMADYSTLYNDGSGDMSAAEYEKNAENLNRTIKSMEKRLKSMTGEKASINTTIDMLEMSAQQTMISYLQMEKNAQAAEKQAEAAEVKYQNTLTRQSAGMATDSAVESAHASMLTAQGQAVMSRQQADQLRRSLLQMTGLPDDGTTEIRELGEPDLAGIASISYDADKEASINVDSAVKSARHSRMSSSLTHDLNEAAETKAVGEAMADYDTAYLLVQTRLAEYQSAAPVMNAAEQSYQGAVRKKNAGMLTNADWLSAEAAYISAKAAYQNALMNLTSAYENYKWLVKGIM